MAKIKAGTYKFNDTLTIPSTNLEQAIEFTFNSEPITHTDGTVEVITWAGNCIKLIAPNIYYALCDVTPRVNHSGVDVWETLIGEQSPYDCAVYCNEWTAYGKVITNNGSAQTITILYDQDVSDEYAVWHNANTVQLDAGEPLVTIKYNGETIANLLAGQKATLKCQGDNVKMLSDIEVQTSNVQTAENLDTILTEQAELIATLQETLANKASGKEPVLQTLEVNLTETGVFEFTPDANYDGIGKIIIGVGVPQLTAPTISIDGDTLTIETTHDDTESFTIFADDIEVATMLNEGV